MKYCVIKTSGGQYKVSEGDTIEISGFKSDKGKEMLFEEILLVCDEGKIKIGNPFVKDAVVSAEVLDQVLGEKIFISKFRAKTGYRRKMGFRAQKTKLLIKKIK